MPLPSYGQNIKRTENLDAVADNEKRYGSNIVRLILDTTIPTFAQVIRKWNRSDS